MKRFFSLPVVIRPRPLADKQRPACISFFSWSSVIEVVFLFSNNEHEESITWMQAIVQIPNPLNLL